MSRLDANDHVVFDERIEQAVVRVVGATEEDKCLVMAEDIPVHPLPVSIGVGRQRIEDRNRRQVAILCKRPCGMTTDPSPAKLGSLRTPRRDNSLPMTTSLFWILWISNRRAMATGNHDRLRNIAQQIDSIGF